MAVSYCGCLQRLIIQDTLISRKGIKWIVRANFPNLHSLTLGGQVLDDEKLIELSKIQAKQVSLLELPNSRYSYRGFKHLIPVLETEHPDTPLFLYCLVRSRKSFIRWIGRQEQLCLQATGRPNDIASPGSSLDRCIDAWLIFTQKVLHDFETSAVSFLYQCRVRIRAHTGVNYVHGHKIINRRQRFAYKNAFNIRN